MIRRLFHRRNRWMDDASAYVDGELSAARRDAFRHELVISPELRQEVEDLRATKAVLASLPAAEPRRTYTLTPAQAGRRARPRPRGGALAGMRTAAAVSTIAIAALAAVVTVDLTSDEMPRLAANGESPTAALTAPQAATQAEESTTAAALDTTESNAATDAPANATGLAQEEAMQTKGSVDEESSPAIAARSSEPPAAAAEAAITTDTEAEETAPAEDGDSAVAALPPAPAAAGAASGEGIADIATAFSTDDSATSDDDWLLVLELALGGVGIVGIATMFLLRRRGTA